MGGQRYPEPTVGALIFNDCGELLLIRGKKFKDRYVIPGGHIEIGETMETALIREVREETGLELAEYQIIGLQEALFPEAYPERRHFIYIDFYCRAKPGPVVLNEEGQEYLWVTPEAALALPLEAYTRGLIREFRKGENSAFQRKILYRIGVENDTIESGGQEGTRLFEQD
ncbi:MAG TPA: NUDIX domain-containing protein [Capillibacterium sp.]